MGSVVIVNIVSNDVNFHSELRKVLMAHKPLFQRCDIYFDNETDELGSASSVLF